MHMYKNLLQGSSLIERETTQSPGGVMEGEKTNLCAQFSNLCSQFSNLCFQFNYLSAQMT